MAEVRCPNCECCLHVPAGFSRKKVRCPQCDASFLISADNKSASGESPPPLPPSFSSKPDRRDAPAIEPSRSEYYHRRAPLLPLLLAVLLVPASGFITYALLSPQNQSGIDGEERGSGAGTAARFDPRDFRATKHWAAALCRAVRRTIVEAGGNQLVVEQTLRESDRRLQAFANGIVEWELAVQDVSREVVRIKAFWPEMPAQRRRTSTDLVVAFVDADGQTVAPYIGGHWLRDDAISVWTNQYANLPIGTHITMEEALTLRRGDPIRIRATIRSISVIGNGSFVYVELMEPTVI